MFLALLSALLLGGSAHAQSAAPYGIGRPATAEQIKGWDIDIRGDDGRGLPPGKGTVKQGEELYLSQCASCHGEFGEGNGRWPELMGGKGTLTSDDPRKTVGSYWPYAPTLFDYIRRTMPFTAPQSLSDDEVYAITAYILNLNDLLPADATLDAAGLVAIRLPNRDGFIEGDPRPDTASPAAPCMTNCRKAPPKVTSDLAERLGVTPSRKPKD
ncbi:c-type cytochrome [Reyranella sp. CPCC 100927]|uniref:c-type cytochrome n=1 Tax=Reyranella sp. CPCC 100927 TaxID=2599616 RepID=UPI0011B5B075|nr:cytochrome c [Reyranella sp. CPCC 100927]TWS98335.1 cytochrome c [Reyranella sp. CPCC 100927]